MTHPRVRQYLAVKNNRTPNNDPEIALAIEGLWELRAAVRAGLDVEAVFVATELLRGDESRTLVERLESASTPCYHVSDKVLRRMVDRDGPDGLAAIVRMRQATFDDLVPGDHRPLRIVVAEGLELAGNAGTIVRSADAAGATGVVWCGSSVRLSHPRVLHASMGTLFSMPVVRAVAPETVEWLRANHVRLVGADPAASHTFWDADLRPPLAIVLGSERRGLSPAMRDALDDAVSIPMLGAADSVNVGHAAAVLLYESVRQAQDQ